MTTIRRRREDGDDGDYEITESESNRFIVKVAEVLQSTMDEHGWSEDVVREAFAETVDTMPKGRARKALQMNFEEYADKLCDTMYRNQGPSIELTKYEKKIAKMEKDPENAWFALKQPPLGNLDEATFKELCVEFDYALKRASFSVPPHVFMELFSLRDELKQKDIDIIEEGRENGLRRILDVASASLKAFKAMGSKCKPSHYEELDMLIGRLAGATSCRRKIQGARVQTAKMAAEVLMLRHDLRVAAKVDYKFPEFAHDVGVTANHDGAILLGNYRGDIAALLGERIPEDEDAAVKTFGAHDHPLFECALGLGGFDQEFEKSAKKAGMLFGALDIDTGLKDARKSQPPSLLRRPPKAEFDHTKPTNDYDMEAYAAMPAEPSARTIAEEQFDNVDYVDTDYLQEALSMSGKDDDENSGPGRVKLYFSVVRIARVYIKLLNATGKRQRSASVARYMSNAPSPEVLLMHVPDACGIDNTDGRAMTVELVVASAKMLRLIVDEWNEMRTLFKNATREDGGFFIDVAGAPDELMREAAKLGDQAAELDAEGGIDPETEAELMEMLDKLEPPDKSDDESDEESDDEE